MEMHTTVAGGDNNRATRQNATVGGGERNRAEGFASVVAGGQFNTNTTNAANGSIGGGLGNTVTGVRGTVPGGESNSATTYAFAAGRNAKAIHEGAFVWADGSGVGNFSSTNANSFNVRAGGGVRFTSGSTNANTTVRWTPGNAAWSFTSDEASKECFRAVDPRDILRRVAGLPITEWNYIGYTQRNIGPTAQDFHAAFPISEDDKSINTGHLHGVSLAAIQGLVEELKERDTRIAELEARDATRAAELSAIREQLSQLPPAP
jgi:hypothetical protein